MHFAGFFSLCNVSSWSSHLLKLYVFTFQNQKRSSLESEYLHCISYFSFLNTVQQMEFAYLLPQLNKISHTLFHNDEEVAGDVQVRLIRISLMLHP